MSVLSKLLMNKTYRSRPDIMAAFESAGIATASQRGIHILGYLAEQAFICFGPHIGKQPSFALFDEWVAPTPELPRDKALIKLAVCYFTSHGPATKCDLAARTGLTLSDTRRSIELAGQALTAVDTDTARYWTSTAQLSPTSAEAVYLLPGFDEYMLGYRDRKAALAAEHSERIVPGGNGMFLATVIVNAQVAGTWRKIVRRQAVEIIVIPFGSFTRTQQEAVRTAALRYGQFLGMPVNITFS